MYSAAIRNSSSVAERPRLSRTGLGERPARLSREKFCMLRAPVWMTSACCSTNSLEAVGGGRGFVGAAAEEARPGRAHGGGDGESLLAAFDGAGAGDDGE